MNQESLEWIPVASSNIAQIAYDGSGGLWVEFASGDIYSYTGVPERVFEDFKNASSAGKFFHGNIRNAYPTEKQ